VQTSNKIFTAMQHERTSVECYTGIHVGLYKADKAKSKLLWRPTSEK